MHWKSKYSTTKAKSEVLVKGVMTARLKGNFVVIFEEFISEFEITPKKRIA